MRELEYITDEEGRRYPTDQPFTQRDQEGEPMTGLYIITATIESDKRGWHSVRQVPTFLLDENVQGIIDEAHAIRIATSIIRATEDYDNFVHVCAVRIER